MCLLAYACLPHCDCHGADSREWGWWWFLHSLTIDLWSFDKTHLCIEQNEERGWAGVSRHKENRGRWAKDDQDVKIIIMKKKCSCLLAVAPTKFSLSAITLKLPTIPLVTAGLGSSLLQIFWNLVNSIYQRLHYSYIQRTVKAVINIPN